jgi:enoyl-CoA hydratase
MQDSQVLLDVQDGVAILTLNRAEKRNALTAREAQQMIDACDEIDDDLTIGALVVRGAEGHFCAGADLDVLKTVSRDPVREDHFEMLGKIYASFKRVGSLSVPVIAAVRGAAAGAGINLLLAADLRIVSEDARLFAGFLRIGIHPGGGFFRLMSRAAGAQAAVATGIFSEEIDGRRAYELGLAWRTVPDAQVEPLALEMAQRAARDPILARRAISSFRNLADAPWTAALEAERTAQMWSLRRRYAAGQGDAS